MYMKSNVMKILFITFCVSGVLAVEAQSCKDVVATSEAKSVVVQSNVTGCQYRVTSDSGKTVKVYVNSTSGTKCVTVASGGVSETLCPQGTNNQFTSQEPIEVSAESGTTTTAAATTEASTAEITTAATKPGGDSEPKLDGSNVDKKADGKSKTEEKQEKQADSEGKANELQGKQKQPDNKNGDMENHPPAGPQDPNLEEGRIPVPVKLLRRTRDISNTDVTVYYVLEVHEKQQKQPPKVSNEEMVKDSPISPNQSEQHPKNPDESIAAPSKLTQKAKDTANTDDTVYYVLGGYCKAAISLYKVQRIADRLFKEKCAAADT
ncbi:unnamed protein product [Echinostoma caproni]|uniref:Cystatin domain-containing protein n=1 Tax=Echinostoma caproni TaxID=27848 RepID=A0A183AA83_9TREM|nr:unnamed protein product [Echinostoma caproni]